MKERDTEDLKVVIGRCPAISSIHDSRNGSGDT
jgi:hypothetical protein